MILDLRDIIPIPQTTEKRIYCVRTEPNRECIAKRHLETWIDELYMPMCERATVLDITQPGTDANGNLVRVKVSTQRVSGPILRGYLFIRIAMSPAAAIEIGKTAGVLCLYPSNSKPCAISDEAFDRLKNCCDTLANSSVPDVDYSWMLDKEQRVIGGTYAGYKGMCIDIMKGHAILKLEMFKTEIPVPVPVECIEPESINVTPSAEENHVVKSTMFGYKRPRKHAY